MFGLWNKNAAPPASASGGAALEASVRHALPEADAETVRVVAALTGLLGAVAYADRNYSAEEEQRVRLELSRVSGMTEEGSNAICLALRTHVLEIATVQAPRYSRTLVELADRELRLEVLQALVGLGASDGTITVQETNLLRQLTGSLGLSQQDYNDAQAEHRARLAVL